MLSSTYKRFSRAWPCPRSQTCTSVGPEIECSQICTGVAPSMYMLSSMYKRCSGVRPSLRSQTCTSFDPEIRSTQICTSVAPSMHEPSNMYKRCSRAGPLEFGRRLDISMLIRKPRYIALMLTGHRCCPASMLARL